MYVQIAMASNKKTFLARANEKKKKKKSTCYSAMDGKHKYLQAL